MRAFAFIFGIVFLIFGIAGFVPDFIVEDHLVDVFRVNLWLNTLHIVSGVFGLIVGFWGRRATRIYFQIIGILFAILALLGFIYEDRPIFEVIASNSPDTWFHVIMAIAALILGFGSKD